MGYSWIFSAPVVCADESPEFSDAVFMAYFRHTHMEDEMVQGYVQFILPYTHEALKLKFPHFTWMKSLNDPQIYFAYLNPALNPVVMGNPRFKLEYKSRAQMLMKKFKGMKKIKEQILQQSLETVTRFLQ